MDYTVTITETQKKAMETVMVDIDEWITNAATVRADIAIQEIIKLNMAHCNANGITIATGEEAQVAQAYELGVVSKATAESSSP